MPYRTLNKNFTASLQVNIIFLGKMYDALLSIDGLEPIEPIFIFMILTKSSHLLFRKIFEQ